jgi:hypothetical protein
MAELSPAAQVVWAAYLDQSEIDETPADLPALAAAFRAVASILRNAYANEECIDSADDFLDGIAAELGAD